MRNMATPRVSVIPAEEAFIITVGVSHRHREHDCGRALRALEAKGFTAGPTSDNALLALARQVELTQQLEQNDD